MVIMGIVLVLMETIMVCTGMWWILLVDVKSYWKNAQNTIENVMGLMVIMGIVLVLMETIMVCTGMWWILLVGMLILLDKCPKHATKINFVMFYWKKLMVYNGILMETLGFLWWFLLHKAVNVITKRQSNKLSNEELNTETRANPDRSSEACLTTASRDVTATITVHSHRRRRERQSGRKSFIFNVSRGRERCGTFWTMRASRRV